MVKTLEENVNVNGQEENKMNFEGQEQDLQPELKIERTTAIEKDYVNKTIKNLVKTKEKLRFDLVIQRGNAWSLEQKSLFVHSLIYGYPFPPAYAQDLEDGTGQLWMLDGKQRLTTIIDFVENKFKLHKKTPKCFGVNIADKRFKELPEEFRDEILSTSFTIYKMKRLTTEERDTMFIRLNRGTPVSKIAQTRASYSEIIDQVATIGKLEFFENYVLSNTAKNNFTDFELIIQTAMILDENHPLKGLGSIQIQNYVDDLKAKNELLSDEVFNKFVSADDYLSVVANELSKAEVSQIFKKVHVPMIILTALKAVENKVDSSVFGDFLVDFLIKNYSKETAYGVAVQSGSAKKDNVVIRLTEMDKAFVDFVNARIDDEGQKLTLSVEDITKQVG